MKKHFWIIGGLCLSVGGAITSAYAGDAERVRHTGEQSFQDLKLDPNAFAGIACDRSSVKNLPSSSSRPTQHSNSGNSISAY